MSANNRVYFPNLNGVRFLAALVVIIHHVEMTKHWFGLPNIYTNSFVGGIFGQLGIILFFVLSGFLITYLLLEEQRRSGTISIKDFYIRRILRIWPVYYLVVLLSLFVFPGISFLDIPGFTEHMPEGFLYKCIAYLTFLPNVAYAVYEHIPYATQTWSVGVEEQFYLIWPVLMHWALKKKKVMPMLLGTIAVYLAIKTAFVVNYIQSPGDVVAEKAWLFVDHFSIDCMAIGGIGAYLLFYNKKKALNILFNKYLQAALYIILAIITVKGWVLPWYNKEWYALIFMVLVLNLAANNKSLVTLEFKPLNYLGKISYGLYMYHNLVLTVVLKIIMMYNLADLGNAWVNIAFHIVALALTVVVSGVSYEYFEKWFLAAKTRYAKVQSGDKISSSEASQPQVATHGQVQVAPQRA